MDALAVGFFVVRNSLVLSETPESNRVAETDRRFGLSIVLRALLVIRAAHKADVTETRRKRPDLAG